MHFPTPVLEELRAGRVLPIVGAGLSRNAEVPSGRVIPLWDELGRAIAKDVPGYGYMGAVDALSAFEYEFGRRELVRRIARELLIREARPGHVHDAFCGLGFSRVVTTNFDFLLERGYERAGRPCDVVIDEEQLVLPAPQNGTVLIKLHGDLRHPGRMIASESDFDGFLARYPVLATHLASLLIDRIPLLIGYSLDDPDLRQVLSLLRDRLGSVLPHPYTILVGADQSAVARYERRGIKAINLPGSRDGYGAILARAFEELGDYWQEHVLGEASFNTEAPLEQVETATTRAASRLCYFSVPRHLLPFYRDEIFPLAEQVLLVPVSGADVDVVEGNRLVATGALISRSRVVVIDVTEQTGSVELNAALQLIGPENVLVIAATPPRFVAELLSRITIILRSPTLTQERDDAFLSQVEAWLAERSPPTAQIGSEAHVLLEQSQWRPALIAAIADLETLLRQAPGLGSQRTETYGRTPRFTLRQALSDPSLPIDDDMRSRLLQWVALRNGALHEDATVTPAQAREAVADVEEVSTLRAGAH
jgi:hypothetical protein